MAQVRPDGARLEIAFSRWEALFVRRQRLQLDSAEIERVELVERPLREHRGPRVGFWVTGVLMVGFFGSPFGNAPRCLAAIRRQTTALHLHLDGRRDFDEVLVSVPTAAEAEAIANTLAVAS